MKSFPIVLPDIDYGLVNMPPGHVTEGAHKRLGFSAIGGRKAKAEKIAAILAAAGSPLKSTHKVLDLGCGSGEIATYLARYADISCSDAIDQRTTGLELPFYIATTPLPFADASFDIIISNHVIEHTLDPTSHIREIHRLLRPDGVAYLATPNRWWFWEVHTHLPLLHFLPWRWFTKIGIALGRLHEPVQLLSLRQLRRLCGHQLRIEVWHSQVLKKPDQFSLTVPVWLEHLFRLVPASFIRLTASMQPTIIVVLRPE